MPMTHSMALHGNMPHSMAQADGVSNVTTMTKAKVASSMAVV